MITETGFNKNRSDHDIVADILAAAKDGAIGKTKIMYRCSLSFDQLNRYLPRLIELSYLSESAEGYRTTGSGLKLLEQIKDVQSKWKGVEKREGTAQ